MISTALVVGAGQGMGRAIAERLAGKGMHVHLAARRREPLEEVAAMIRERGGSAAVHVCDATDPDEVARLFAELGDRLDVVVHTVGRSLMNDFAGTTVEDWDTTINANLRSAFLVAHGSLPLLRRSDNPSLVLISSKTAVKGYGVVAYSAAKAGVVGMARALAAELAPERIRVVPLCPGPTDTPMRWAATPDFDPGVVTEVENVAATVEYVVGLERGTTVDTIIVQRAIYD